MPSHIIYDMFFMVYTCKYDVYHLYVSLIEDDICAYHLLNLNFAANNGDMRGYDLIRPDVK